MSERGASGPPPLGPEARAILPLQGLLSLARTVGMIAFATGLGALLARLAADGFAAQAAAGTDSPQGLAEFLGSAAAHLDGVLPASWVHDGPWWAWPAVWLAVLGAVLRAGAQWAASAAARRGAARTISRIRSQLLLRLLESGPGRAAADDDDRPEDHPGAAAVLVARGLDALDDYYVRAVSAMVATAVAPAVLWLWILRHDGISAAIIALTLPLVPLFMVLIGRTTQDQTRRAQDAQLRLSRHIVELARGLPVLVGLRRDRAQARALAQLDDQHRRRTMQTLRSAFLSSLALELITTLSVALVAVFIGVRLVDGSLGLDTAVMVLLLAPECYQPLRDVGTAYHQSQDGVDALRRSQRLLQAPRGRAVPEAAEGTARLEIRGLRVRHDGRREVIGPLDLRAEAGQITALSGASGSGKTTVLSAVAGLIAGASSLQGRDAAEREDDGPGAGVLSGRILVPGPVRLVPQSPAFMAGTAAEEVALALAPGLADLLLVAAEPMASARRQQVSEELCDARARAADHLARLGLAGLEQTPPEALSAGQARRLALARTAASLEALSGSDPGTRPTVLVDEPTAHLDGEAAHLAAVCLREMARAGAVVLVVSHDRDLIVSADRHVELTMDGTATDGALSAAAGARREPSPQSAAPQHEREEGRAHDSEHGHPAAAAARAPATAPARARAAAWAAEGAEVMAAPARSAAAEQRRRVSPLGTVRTVLRLSGISWPQAGLSAALAVLTIGFGAALTALSGWLIVRAGQQPGMMYLMLAVTGVRFFGLGRAVVRYLERLVSHDLALRAAGRMRQRAWKATGGTALGLRTLLSGEVFLDRLITRVEDLRDALPRILLPAAALGPVLLGAVLVSLLTVPEASAPVAIAAVLSALAGPTLVRGLDSRAQSRQAAAQSAALRLSARALHAADDLRVADLGPAVAAAVRAQDERGRRAAQRAAWASGLSEALAVAIWFLAAIAVAVLSWETVASGRVSAATAAVPVLLCTAMVEPTAQGFEAARQWPRFAELVRSVDQAQRGSAADQAEQPRRISGLERIDLEQISARWPGMDRDALHRLSGSIRPGRWWGITGPSGAGKSTALAVLLGFLPPTDGTLRLDGRPTDPQMLRGASAWCPQEATIFDSSLRGNLALARDREQAPSEHEMLAALQRVGLGQFAASLPDGLDTRVGAGGQRLSGGQRQRLAVARAMLTRAPVLLLDEPTAHLDAPTAEQVMAALHEGQHAGAQDGAVQQDRQAVVVISHRPEDVRRCEDLTRLG